MLQKTDYIKICQHGNIWASTKLIHEKFDEWLNINSNKKVISHSLSIIPNEAVIISIVYELRGYSE